MSVFRYVTKDRLGKYHRGEIEAVDEYQASVILRRKKLIVISLKPHQDSGVKFWDKLFLRVSFAELVVTTRQLATMIEAGLVVSEALDILEEEQTNKKLKKVLKGVSLDVKGGLDLAVALEKHPDVFPDIYTKLVRAGQASGKLDTILLELAANLEKERSFRGKIKGAMIYPVVVISMMGVVMLIMIFFVLPRLMGLYKESGIDLPLPTKIVIGFSNFMISFWWAIGLGLALAVLALKNYTKSADGKIMVDRILLKTPVIGKLVGLVAMTNFTRTFGLLTAAGLPILDAIRIVSDVVGNNSYKESLKIVYKGVERGLTLSSQLLGLPIFPRIVGQMARTGEETGKLDDIMTKLSDYFETEVDTSLKNITTLIEPIVLVILGIGVGFLVISIILPIYQLTTSIK